MLQDVLAEEEWAGLLGPADRRGLTPLFWQHIRPYGEGRLDMGAALRIGGAGGAAGGGTAPPADPASPSAARELAYRPVLDGAGVVGYERLANFRCVVV